MAATPATALARLLQANGPCAGSGKTLRVIPPIQRKLQT
jgi:hypothetical protein